MAGLAFVCYLLLLSGPKEEEEGEGGSASQGRAGVFSLADSSSSTDLCGSLWELFVVGSSGEPTWICRGQQCLASSS